MSETLDLEERLLRQTLLNLLEIFRAEELSDPTEQGLVRAIEGLRFDLRGRIPDAGFWNELDTKLTGMGRDRRRRFERHVSEMLLAGASRGGR